MIPFCPIGKAEEVACIVSKGFERKYYRISRPGRWYGGIASADCCGCNLQCIFCWSDKPRENPDKYGEFFSPEHVGENLVKCAREHDYHLVRISGNEPTIAKEHLLKVIRFINRTRLSFIMETNGTLLDDQFVQELAQFRNLHVRVSLKGTSPDEFAVLTGAIPETFEKIMAGLVLLNRYSIDFNLAVMMSFSPDKNIALLKKRLKAISSGIMDDFEEEYVILYPHVARKLKQARVDPLIAYTPRGVPKHLV